uniref:Ovule protein n=1 Tax=Haemonchus contortus TaxID=6289 RepID=A0A7I4YA37_HAECO
ICHTIDFQPRRRNQKKIMDVVSRRRLISKEAMHRITFKEHMGQIGSESSNSQS